MVANPTPGPWRITLQENRLLILDRWDGLVAIVPDASRPEARANAELIAEAPSLAAVAGWAPKGETDAT